MTVSAQNSYISYTGNGSTSAYSWPYKLFAAGDLKVYTVVIATGVETLQTSGGAGTYDYTISVAGDYSGATVTLNNNLPTTHKVFLTRVQALEQATDYIEGDAFPAETHEQTLDKIVLQLQQHEEQLKRALKFKQSTATRSEPAIPELSADTLIKVNAAGTGFETQSTVDVSTVAGIAADVTTVSGIAADVSTVAADGADIGTVATNIASVNTCATNIADIVTVANDLNEAVSEIETVAADLQEAQPEIDLVAGSIANVDLVGGSIANVNTVAGSIGNVNNVGNDIAAVNNVAANLTGINAFNERYRVSATDPTTSLDSGDLNFNTGSSELKYYDGSNWQTVASQDQNVKVSASDTSASVLNSKIAVAGGLTKTITNPGSNEILTLTAQAAEVYGFELVDTDADGVVDTLRVHTTNGGADNISSSTYANFDDVIYGASGMSWSLTSDGDLRVTI